MKSGSPTLTVDGTGLRVAVIAASWHETVMDGLIAGARRGLTEAGVARSDLVRVPGTFELTVAAARLAPSYDAVVALGVVIRGGAPHLRYRLPSRHRGTYRRQRPHVCARRVRGPHLRRRASSARPRQPGRLLGGQGS